MKESEIGIQLTPTKLCYVRHFSKMKCHNITTEAPII